MTYSLATAAGKTLLTVAADRRWLDAATLPVRIDPQLFVSTDAEDDTTLWFPGGGAFVAADRAYEQTVYIGSWEGNYSSRSYMNFNLNQLSGKDISSATFKIYQNYHLSCGTQLFSLQRITSSWEGHSMTGPPGPGVGELIGASQQFPCTNDWRSWDVQSTVQGWANQPGTAFGLSLRANQEWGDATSLRGFKSWNVSGCACDIPHIDIMWSEPTTAATPVAPANGALFHTLTPNLTVSASDPDSTVYYYYRVARYVGPGNGDNAESNVVYNSGWVTSASLAVPAGILAWNATYTWHVYTWDGVQASAKAPNWVWWFVPVNSSPAMANPLAPANGANINNLTPTLSVSSSDPDNDSIQYYYRLSKYVGPGNGDNAETNVVYNSGWVLGASRAVPAGVLTWGSTYTWHVYTWDGNTVNGVTPNWVWSFAVFSEITATPGNVGATPGDTTASVSWTAPLLSVPLLTTYTVRTYRVTDNVLIGVTPAGTSPPTSVTGLRNGTPYHFTVSATNVLASPESQPSNSVTPAGVPFQPTAVSAAPGAGRATVSWTPPPARPDGTPGDNGSVITNYVITASPGGATSSSASSPADVAGLANGSSYTFTVRATNAIGTGAESLPSTAVTPVGAPSPPTGVTATGGTTQATVYWSPSEANGSPVTSYTATATPGGASASIGGAANNVTVTGLTPGTSYTFQVVATSAIGTSAPSAATNAVTPLGPPSRPTGVTATASVGQAGVQWSPSSPNGSPVTSYTVTATPGGADASVDGTTTTATVSGLNAATGYTFTVVATNAFGTSAPSLPSTATVTAGVPNSPTGVTATGGDSQATVNWSPSNNGNGSTVTQYKVTASPGGTYSITDASTFSVGVGGLVNGTTYTFTVEAINAVGSSTPSGPSNAVWPLRGFVDAVDSPRTDLYLQWIDIDPQGESAPIPCSRIVRTSGHAVYTCRNYEAVDVLFASSAVHRVAYLPPGDVSGGGNYTLYVGDKNYEGCRYVESSSSWHCSTTYPKPFFAMPAIGANPSSFTGLVMSKWSINQATVALCVDALFSSIATWSTQDVVNNCA